MKCFWMSWYQQSEDYRPLTYPPNAAILGWWCSGVRDDDEGSSILCAAVLAESMELAEAAVHLDWPEAREWRFCSERDLNFLPGDRFPLAAWMAERFLAAKRQK